MDPILVEDFEVEALPQSVKNIITSLEQCVTEPSRNDILVGVIYILMLEYGFVPNHCKDSSPNQGFNLKQLLEYSKELPQNWKEHGIYTLWFYLKGYEQNQCNIVCCPSLDDLIVNCYITKIENSVFTMLVDSLSYFSSSNVNARRLNFQNLKGLSFKIKSTICYPVYQTILRSHLRFDKCMEAMPFELILLLKKYLRKFDFQNFQIAFNIQFSINYT
ncbi:uncharacterized protein LOC126887801 [Diabrotica virgifera virgifera]|uniref:Uncharacterized protein LOC114341040 n=1 Tax=Diabrotica virgifera virgifera TaxID=50390 RepID=A0A6P7GDT1_DIAVI|nr:uncharacterized protein LOC126887801 [Diabrotica virgifera virgifera]